MFLVDTVTSIDVIAFGTRLTGVAKPCRIASDAISSLVLLRQCGRTRQGFQGD